MDPFREAGRWLIIVGVVLAVVGGWLLAGRRLPLRLGRLPGDVVIQGRHTAFYFPIVTCLLLSAGLTLIFWLVSTLRR